MIFIGDIHGYWNYYLDLVRNITHTPTIQVGDFGVGFPGRIEPPIVAENHFFIRGNHDNPEVCRNHPRYLGDYGFRPEWNLFFVGGADSIDKNMRVEGVSWWRDEQLDYTTLNTKVLALYEETKPRIMVTHTCPMGLRGQVLPTWAHMSGGSPGPDITERALQAMFEIHQPDVWVFGHWHRNLDFRMFGTRFICLDIHNTIEVEGIG